MAGKGAPCDKEDLVTKFHFDWNGIHGLIFVAYVRGRQGRGVRKAHPFGVRCSMMGSDKNIWQGKRRLAVACGSFYINSTEEKQ
jgi:hypothetical protein